jgi:hypothetical protein
MLDEKEDDRRRTGGHLAEGKNDLLCSALYQKVVVYFAYLQLRLSNLTVLLVEV